jgi:hypothetical protein
MKTKKHTTIGTCYFKSLKHAVAYYHHYCDEEWVKQKIQDGEIQIGKPQKFGHRVQLDSEGRYLLYPLFDIIGQTSDGVLVYWGKKETDNPESRDLTLWVVIGDPTPSADNYRRVPAKDESAYQTNLDWDGNKWAAHMKKRVAKLTANGILSRWQKP